jgi:hypothetical protein
MFDELSLRLESKVEISSTSQSLARGRAVFSFAVVLLIISPCIDANANACCRLLTAWEN